MNSWELSRDSIGQISRDRSHQSNQRGGLLDEATANAIEIIANLLYLINLEADSAVRVREYVKACEEPLNRLLAVSNVGAPQPLITEWNADEKSEVDPI